MVGLRAADEPERSRAQGSPHRRMLRVLGLPEDEPSVMASCNPDLFAGIVVIAVPPLANTIDIWGEAHYAHSKAWSRYS